MPPKRQYNTEAERVSAKNQRRRNTRASMSQNELAQRREANTVAQRERRSQMSENERNALREANAASERERRSQMSENKRNDLREANAASERERRSQMSENERNALREANAASERERRSQMSENERNALREANAASERERRSQMSENERNTLREAHAASEVERRSQMNENERNALREANAASERERRFQMSENERNAFREAHAASEVERRSQMNENERNALREANAAYERERRSQMSENERNAVREAHAASQVERRSQMSENELNALREANAAFQRERRSQMSENELNTFREAHAVFERGRRSQISENERNASRQAHAASERERILQMNQTDRNNLREILAAGQRERRSQMSQDERRDLRAANIARQILPYVGGALYNQSEIDETRIEEHYCGKLDLICGNCSSKNFKDELPQDKKFSSCCHKGKVILPPIQVPEMLRSLLTGQHTLSSNFINNIRKYNSAFAFASMGAQVKPPPGHGPYCFRVHGQVYHQTGPLHPLNGEPRQYAQIYILDPEEALNQRLGIAANVGCQPGLMNELDNMIRTVNPFAKAYKMMREVELEEAEKAASEGRDIHEISMAIVTDRNTDQRRYNAPRVNEVAVVFSSADGAPPFHRDIRVNLRGERRSERISVLHPGLDPMTYPLLFPHGEEGWKPSIKQINSSHNVSQLQHYSYRLAIRDEFSPILNAGKLTQQYCVDSYCKIEANRLNYIQQNQKDLRVENYRVLGELANRAADNNLRVGKQFILPSTFQGSPRAMNQHYQDAMAIVRKFGIPDPFTTMTCNTKWQEITENLLPWQKVEFRPDLVARVFRIKLKDLLHDITHNHVLGVDVAKIHVIEFQKRGLPHSHILVTLREEDKPRTIEMIDKMVSAEIPSPETHPRLHELVKKHMIHGPCGAANPSSPCMQDGICTKKFPKPYISETNPNVDGFPLYRRRNTGLKYFISSKEINNTWVVPYNPYLLLKYNCHINIEICASIHSVKYLYEYVYKGHDCATVEVRRSDGAATLNHNEIESYIDSRYVSAPEAVWRIFEFRMHDQSHFVQKLCLHLPNEQPVYFEEGDEAEAIRRADGRDNTLTAWFKLNQTDPNARQYLYADIPEHYTFVQKDRIWKIRQRGHGKTIGRMYNISVSQGELYYLRLLLLHVRGARSFDEIKTVENTVAQTFKAAAILRHLLEDDTEWDNCLAEAAHYQMPRQLRELFAFICVYCNPLSPKDLWVKYEHHLIEDFIGHGLDQLQATFHALSDIQVTLRANGRSLQTYELPIPPPNFTPLPTISETHDEVNTTTENQPDSRNMVQMLNEMQRAAFDTVVEAVLNENNLQRLFFLDGPGGSGKTFTYEALYHTISGMRLRVTCCASTGIAANLLPFGRTYHSTFGLGPAFEPTTVSSITIRTPAGLALRNTEIIVWDEITMTPFYALDIIDRLLRDLTNDERPFGGKVILLGGDFRQCLPVVKRGNRVKTVEACIQNSHLWHHFIKLKLHTNMRVINENEQEYRDWLLNLGDGNLTNTDELGDDVIEIPPEFIEEGSLLDSIFGDTILPEEVNEFQHKAILCPKNEHVHELNTKVLARLQGESKTYHSVDSLMEQENINPLDYPVEFLNSLAPSGTPPHELILKKGSIIMLLRNLNSIRGLCNGTRLIVEGMNENFIIANVLSGKAQGTTIFIPRIDIVPTDSDLPFQLKRRQFPIMLAFVMTINKSQGQSLDSVGIYLPAPVFSHGQLYVAFSRGRSKTRIKVKVFQNQGQGKLIPGSDRVFTKNVVYKEVFDSTIRTQNSVEDFELLEEYDELMLLHNFDQIMTELNNRDSSSNVSQCPIPNPVVSTPNVPESNIQIPLTAEAETDELHPLHGIEFEPDPDNTMGWYCGEGNVFDIHGNLI